MTYAMAIDILKLNPGKNLTHNKKKGEALQHEHRYTAAGTFILNMQGKNKG